MWILTFEVPEEYGQYGAYHQFSWCVKPDVTYLACYLKHAGLIKGESWDIRQAAEILWEGELVNLYGKVFKLWEQQHPGQLEMY